jgi:hypothetical protein
MTRLPMRTANPENKRRTPTYCVRHFFAEIGEAKVRIRNPKNFAAFRRIA